MNPTTPHEPDCRTPAFRGGHEIVLGDNQRWFVPSPRLVYRVEVDAVSGQLATRLDGSGQSEAYQKRLSQLAQAESDSAFFTCIAGMALELLRENYELPDSAVPELFTWTPGSDSDNRRWFRLEAIVAGRAQPPKAASPGS